MWSFVFLGNEETVQRKMKIIRKQKMWRFILEKVDVDVNWITLA